MPFPAVALYCVFSGSPTRVFKEETRIANVSARSSSTLKDAAAFVAMTLPPYLFVINAFGFSNSAKKLCKRCSISRVHIANTVVAIVLDVVSPN